MTLHLYIVALSLLGFTSTKDIKNKKHRENRKMAKLLSLGNIFLLYFLLISVTWMTNIMGEEDVCSYYFWDDDDCKIGHDFTCFRRCQVKYGEKFIVGSCIKKHFVRHVCQCLYTCPKKKSRFENFMERFKKPNDHEHNNNNHNNNNHNNNEKNNTHNNNHNHNNNNHNHNDKNNNHNNNDKNKNE
ncbi:hypothetical protein PIB30_116969 [Stylosanthes scabra]|uniref:Uncharacterized protein n=1 Tax=Stylosanthes scabra TaxID=79078 RepID=A0ABU6RSP9_9FABA|nr:hypothetical protein [Stylosanthes scabra]